MTSVRAEMIAGAARLLAERGLQATSFSEVLAATGAPRGSLYHHFPGGKAELVVEATRYVGDRLLVALHAARPTTPEELTEQFTRLWRRVLTGSGLTSGCAVASVTVGAPDDQPEILHTAGGVFRSWRSAIGELLISAGVSTREAATFATTLLAAIEGALLIARAEQDIAAFDQVADHLRQDATRLPRQTPPGDMPIEPTTRTAEEM